MRKIRFLCIGTILACLSAFVAIPATHVHAAQAPAGASTSQPPARLAVSGYAGHQYAVTNDSGTTVGSASISSVTPGHFATVNGKTVLQGSATGTVYVNGHAQPFTENFSATVQQVGVTCPVLFLVLGPLNLNLLGLHIVLNQVVANIYADPSGGLLGSLLCSLANLLGPTTVDALLNSLLGQPLTALLNALLGLL